MLEQDVDLVQVDGLGLGLCGEERAGLVCAQWTVFQQLPQGIMLFLVFNIPLMEIIMYLLKRADIVLQRLQVGAELRVRALINDSLKVVHQEPDILYLFLDQMFLLEHHGMIHQSVLLLQDALEGLLRRAQKIRDRVVVLLESCYANMPALALHMRKIMLADLLDDITHGLVPELMGIIHAEPLPDYIKILVLAPDLGEIFRIRMVGKSMIYIDLRGYEKSALFTEQRVTETESDADDLADIALGDLLLGIQLELMGLGETRGMDEHEHVISDVRGSEGDSPLHVRIDALKETIHLKSKQVRVMFPFLFLHQMIHIDSVTALYGRCEPSTSKIEKTLLVIILLMVDDPAYKEDMVASLILIDDLAFKPGRSLLDPAAMDMLSLLLGELGLPELILAHARFSADKKDIILELVCHEIDDEDLGLLDEPA